MRLAFGSDELVVDEVVVKEEFRVTRSPGSTDPVIPDFGRDAAVLAAYNDARTRYERRIASDTEERTRATFAKKRAVIRAEIAAAASFVDERKEKAERALRIYASRYPHRIHGNEPVKPSFWEKLFSFGWAGRLFEHVIVTAREVVHAQSRRRRWERDEDQLEAHLHRTLYLEHDARKKFFEGPDGIAAFHAHPGVAQLRKRVVEINAERTKYAFRLESGQVLPTEQRDREFAEQQISPLELPFASLTIVRISRYGNLTYFILCDLEGKLYYLAYDLRLEPLLDSVLDAYRVADSYEVRISPGPAGKPMTVADLESGDERTRLDRASGKLCASAQNAGQGSRTCRMTGPQSRAGRVQSLSTAASSSRARIGFEMYPSMPAAKQRSRSPVIA
jgi:hypothetical protein